MTKPYNRRLPKIFNDRGEVRDMFSCTFSNHAQLSISSTRNKWGARVYIPKGQDHFDQESLKELIAELLFLSEEMDGSKTVYGGIPAYGHGAGDPLGMAARFQLPVMQADVEFIPDDDEEEQDEMDDDF